MLRIGLTGGIGSGKTTVSDIFSALGVPVIDMDLIARDVVVPGQPALEKIKSLFGDNICSEDGQLDRKALRKLIFNDEQKRKQLEEIIHPAIRQSVKNKLDQLSTAYCIIVIPLLFETGQKDLIDRILVVDSNIEDQIERTKKRDHIEENDVRQIMGSQVDRQTRLNKADDIVHNTGDIASLTSQIEALHEKYLGLSNNFHAL